jgi:hypothetical protein
MTSVYVATIAWREVTCPHMQCVLELQRHAGVRYRVKYGDALIDRQRAQVATHFLTETDDDVLVTIDSDIAFTASAVLQIAEQAQTHDIVAGIYMTRSGVNTRPSSIFEKDVTVPFGTDPTPVPIRWAASGFLATHRRVFETLAKDLVLCHPSESPEERAMTYPFYPFYTPFIVDDDAGRPIYLSEDFAFSERARRAGFGIWANPSVALTHFGSWDYQVQDITLAKFRLPLVPINLTRRLDGFKHGYDVEVPELPAPAPAPEPKLSRAARRHPERHGRVLAHR